MIPRFRPLTSVCLSDRRDDVPIHSAWANKYGTRRTSVMGHHWHPGGVRLATRGLCLGPVAIMARLAKGEEMRTHIRELDGTELLLSLYRILGDDQTNMRRVRQLWNNEAVKNLGLDSAADLSGLLGYLWLTGCVRLLEGGSQIVGLTHEGIVRAEKEILRRNSN